MIKKLFIVDDNSMCAYIYEDTFRCLLFFFLLSICSLKKCRYVIMVNKLLKPTMKTSVHSHM